MEDNKFLNHDLEGLRYASAGLDKPFEHYEGHVDEVLEYFGRLLHIKHAYPGIDIQTLVRPDALNIGRSWMKRGYKESALLGVARAQYVASVFPSQVQLKVVKGGEK
jgi:hypothetical protein